MVTSLFDRLHMLSQVDLASVLQTAFNYLLIMSVMGFWLFHVCLGLVTDKQLPE